MIYNVNRVLVYYTISKCFNVLTITCVIYT